MPIYNNKKYHKKSWWRIWCFGSCLQTFCSRCFVSTATFNSMFVKIKSNSIIKIRYLYRCLSYIRRQSSREVSGNGPWVITGMQELCPRKKERQVGHIVYIIHTRSENILNPNPSSILFFTLNFWNGDNSTLLEWDCIHLFIFALSSDGVSRTCLSTPHLPMKISETCWIDPNPRNKFIPHTISETSSTDNLRNVLIQLMTSLLQCCLPRNRFIFQWQFQKCVDLEQIFCNATSPISFDGNLRNMFILHWKC